MEKRLETRTQMMRKTMLTNPPMPSLKVKLLFLFQDMKLHSLFASTEEEDSEMSEYSEASEDADDDSSEEMGSEEESGKDWSDLEREAAEEDRDRERYGDDKHKHKSTHKSSR